MEPCYPDKPLGPGGPGKPRWPGGPGGPKGPDGPGEPTIDGGGITVLVILTDVLKMCLWLIWIFVLKSKVLFFTFAVTMSEA